MLFVDFAGAFLEVERAIPVELMPDAVHLSDEGYHLWADSVAAALALLEQGTPFER